MASVVKNLPANAGNTMRCGFEKNMNERPVTKLALDLNSNHGT